MAEPFADLGDCDLPATVARLARHQDGDPDWDTLADLPTSDLAILFAIRLNGPTTRHELGDLGVTSSGARYTSVERLVARDLLTSVNQLRATGTVTAYVDAESAAAEESLLVADGGEVLACPECDTTGNLDQRLGSIQGPDTSDRPDWYCGRCGAEFDRPVRRPGDPSGGSLSAHGQALAAADPDDIVSNMGESP